jgi:hypothetical protein
MTTAADGRTLTIIPSMMCPNWRQTSVLPRSGVAALQRSRGVKGTRVGCRPTAREAQDYCRHAVVDNADWEAVDNILMMKNITPQIHSPEEFQRIRDHPSPSPR